MTTTQELIDRTHKHGVAIARQIPELMRLKRGLEALNRRRRHSLEPPLQPPRRRFGIDVAWGTISMAALKRAGVTFVVRYLSHDPSKNLHDDYAKRLSAAAIDIVVVWETTATRALDGRAAGVTDAQEARAQATACGMPPGRPIYFAVDSDVGAIAVAPYFRGVASVLTPRGTGVYGSYRVVLGLMRAGIVRWGWQTYAWSGGHWVAAAQLFQYSNGHTIGGVDVDYDHSSTVADFGAWRA